MKQRQQNFRRVSQRFRSAKGFTLIEFTIVMLISGLLMAAIIQGYRLYLQEKNVREVYAKIDSINGAISGFLSAVKRYPCPADPTLPVNHPQAGLERCDLANALADNTCTPSGGICRVDGARPIAATGTVSQNPVFVGGVPYRTIKTGIEERAAAICYFVVDGKYAGNTEAQCSAHGDDVYYPNRATFESTSLQDILDPWGFQMTYAVTASQTDITSFDTSFGTIDVKTERGISIVQPEGSVHFVVIAHGENHKGAYNGQGQMPFACTNGTADAQNCKKTSSFISGLRNLGEESNYFDDVLLQKSYSMSELWRFEGDDGSVIYNVNPGNVGIGTADPVAKLDVNGTMRTGQVRTDLICDRGGGNCWQIDKLAGAGMKCPDASLPSKVSIMRGIGQADVVPYCAEIDKPRIKPGQVCPADQFVTAISASGDIECKNPLTPP